MKKKEATSHRIELIGLIGVPEIKAKDDLSSVIVSAVSQTSVAIERQNIFVIAQKIVSKSEGRLVSLCNVKPSNFARQLASQRYDDPRFIELILQESRRIVRMNERVIITETHHGFICANAGLDRSNVENIDEVCLLPLDPDRSARQLRTHLEDHFKKPIAVIITDTFGRPWREGLLNVAIGVAGINPLEDLRREKDDHGRMMKATVLATADEIAAASGLVMRKTRRQPVVLVKGFEFEFEEGTARQLIRDQSQDLFR